MTYKKVIKITNNWNGCAGCDTVTRPRYGIEIWHGGCCMGMDESSDVYCAVCVPRDADGNPIEDRVDSY